MRSMGTRRAALFAGAATVAALALTGCSAGQTAETATKRSSIYGLNTGNADQSVLIRDLAVSYHSSRGYPAGGDAPLELTLVNQTAQPIRVTITSQPATGPAKGILSARTVGFSGGTEAAPASTSSAAPAGTPALTEPASTPSTGRPTRAGEPSSSATARPEASGSATTEPSATPTPTEPAARPAEITIAALGAVRFRPDDAESLQLIGLSGPLVPGNSVNLTFSFSNGVAPLTVLAPVAIPLSPAPRGSAANVDAAEAAGR